MHAEGGGRRFSNFREMRVRVVIRGELGKPHMGEGGDAPPLASKNLSPPLEPKIRDLQKDLWPKKGESAILF